MSGTASEGELPTGSPPPPTARWFSANPEKAWGERFFLLYTPVWMAGMGTLMATGAGGRWGDLALNLAVWGLAAPLLVVPALMGAGSAQGRRWHQRYWLKFNLWIAILSGVGTYFGSEYFFDVLGMVYDYPQLGWNFDSVLVGSGEQTVPLIMYPSAHFYFVTYHSCAVVLMRRVRTSALGAGRWFVWPLVVAATAYFFAWAETFMMTGGSIADQFYYRDIPRMLRWGSLMYGCYFFVSFPMVYRLDEGERENWTLTRTATEALAAAMLVILLLDLVTRYVGKLY